MTPFLCDGLNEREAYSTTTKRFKGVLTVRLQRIEDGKCIRQHLGRFMVITDDDFHTVGASILNLGDCRDPAIDRDEQRRAELLAAVDAGGRESISLLDAV